MLATFLLASALAAQEPATDSGFFRKHDVTRTVIAVAATVALSAFDERIARWTRQPRIQGDSVRYDRIKVVTQVNEMPLTLAAVATYGVGRLTGSRTVADVGLHLTESLVATVLVSEVVRIGLGRARPRASPDDAFVFGPGKGLTHFENRAFPSIHAAAAFTTAATLVEEIRERKPSAVMYSAPLLYGAAMVPGFSRLYLDQHWASDVLAGTVLGAFIGMRVVRYAHGRRTRLDRMLLGARVAPSPEGVEIGWSFQY